MINIVLFEPEIAENTGNIMRTCAGFNINLHLIEPLGFYLDEKHLKRSGVNYIDKVNYFLYDDLNDFLDKNQGEFYYFTRYATTAPSEIDFKNIRKDIYLFFGSESKGLPKDLLSKNLNKCIRIPISNNIRCLNLSNSVAIGAYEVVKQMDYGDLMLYDEFKGKEYLKDN